MISMTCVPSVTASRSRYLTNFDASSEGGARSCFRTGCHGPIEAGDGMAARGGGRIPEFSQGQGFA